MDTAFLFMKVENKLMTFSPKFGAKNLGFVLAVYPECNKRQLTSAKIKGENRNNLPLAVFND